MIGSLKADVVVRAEFPSQCSGEKRNFGLLSFFSNEASVSVSVHAHQHF